MNSDLAEDYRLVAMDLRGHGLSGKPREGYTESKLWAEDVDAIIRTLGLDRPVLCGWSYGPLVILDYIRHYGEEGVGGLHFVDAVTKLVDRRCFLLPDVLPVSQVYHCSHKRYLCLIVYCPSFFPAVDVGQAAITFRVKIQ